MTTKIFEQFNCPSVKFEDRLREPILVGATGTLQTLVNSLPPYTKRQVLNTPIGIEVEIENAGTFTLDGWSAKADGSLRNSGIEFVTNVGCRAYNAYKLLSDLFKRFARQSPMFEFSERCSIHVHLDAQRFNEEEVRSLLILYSIFEDALFEFAGSERKSNIFCVPIEYLSTDKRDNMFVTISEWKKYSALNLATLREFGTFEFRHMEGTHDYERICTWVIILCLLRSAAKRIPLDEIQHLAMDCKRERTFTPLLSRVFYQFSSLLNTTDSKLSNAISDSKQFFRMVA